MTVRVASGSTATAQASSRRCPLLAADSLHEFAERDRHLHIGFWTTSKIDELKIVDVDEGLFRVPPGLRHQEPVFGAPGR